MARLPRITRFEMVLFAGPRALDRAAPPEDLLTAWTGAFEPLAALCVDVDGAPFVSTAEAAELWRALAWFRAGEALIRGALTYEEDPWEGARLVVRRQGPTLAIEAQDRAIRVPADDWHVLLAAEARTLGPRLGEVRRLARAASDRHEHDAARRAPFHHLAENDLPRPEELAVLDVVGAWRP